MTSNNSGDKKLPKATHGAADNPLKIGDIEIPCYVLDDGTRMLVQRGLVWALGMKRGGDVRRGGDRLARFINGERLQPFVSKELRVAITNPILFVAPNNSTAYGYEATLLADICDVMLEARKQGVLQKQQQHIADRCESLLRGIARVGIIALVDEVTGYQQSRKANELRQILEQYIAPELRPWAKTFEDEFYEQIFRLRGWSYPSRSASRPQIVGKFTNEIIYKRFPPGVLEELQRLNPVSKKGRRERKHFQHLTAEFGKSQLKSHLFHVTKLMKMCSTWDKFIFLLDQTLPKYDSTPNIPGLEIDLQS